MLGWRETGSRNDDLPADDFIGCFKHLNSAVVGGME